MVPDPVLYDVGSTGVSTLGFYNICDTDKVFFVDCSQGYFDSLYIHDRCLCHNSIFIIHVYKYNILMSFPYGKSLLIVVGFKIFQDPVGEVDVSGIVLSLQEFPACLFAGYRVGNRRIEIQVQ